MHMALGGEVIDLVRLHFLHDADQVGGIGHVAVMQDEPGVFDMRILKQVVDAPGVEARRAPLDAVDDIPLAEQKFSQIGAVLSGNPGNKCNAR